jgi:hypothetical protein
MAFLMGARPDEVQDAIGYTDDQWHRFYVSLFNLIGRRLGVDGAQMVTRNEAKTLLNQHAWRSYTEIPANERTILLKRVNDTLSAEDIPEVSAKALRWRMTNLIRDFKKKLGMHSY